MPQSRGRKSPQQPSTPEPTSPVALPQRQQRRQRPIRRFVVWTIAGFLIAIVVVFGVGLYAFDWNDQVTNRVISVIPYPAARVGNHVVTYRDFRDDIETLHHYYSNQSVSTSGSLPSDAQIEELVLNRLIRDYQTKLLARERGIVVTSADVESRFQQLVTEAGSIDTIEKTLTELYAWDVPTFKSKVIEPYLYRERLQQSLAQDPDLTRVPRQKAQDLLDQIKAGASFEDLAKANSDDSGTASNGGDLGYFGRGVMVAAFEDAAFALDVGEVSDIIQSPFGYHIIKLEDKRTKDVDGTNVEEIRARHILISTTDVDAWVTDQLKKVSVNGFARPNYWDGAQGRIVNRTAAQATAATQ